MFTKPTPEPEHDYDSEQATELGPETETAQLPILDRIINAMGEGFKIIKNAEINRIFEIIYGFIAYLLCLRFTASTKNPLQLSTKEGQEPYNKDLDKKCAGSWLIWGGILVIYLFFAFVLGPGALLGVFVLLPSLWLFSKTLNAHKSILDGKDGSEDDNNANNNANSNIKNTHIKKLINKFIMLIILNIIATLACSKFLF
jgi:hypothetical protein